MFDVRIIDGGVAMVSPDDYRLRIVFMSSSIARVTYTKGRDFREDNSRIVTMTNRFNEADVKEEANSLSISASCLSIFVDKETGSLTYRDRSSKVLFREPDKGGKWLTSKRVYRNVFNRDAEIAYGLSIDGARAVAEPDQVIFDRDAFEAKLEFVFSENEAIFGLGSHEEGYGNLRGKSRELYQQNMKVVVPFFVSTRGYGVLLDCCSLMAFHDDALGSYLWADVVDELDFYVLQGDTYDEVTHGYHELSGKAPMLPKWALGYVQSKERYVNAQELVDTVAEYRRRSIPLDCIVLDWKSWPNGEGWGQKSLDPIRFPNPSCMIDALHAMGVKLMVSIWPIMTGGCPNQRELLECNLMLGNRSTYDAFNADARSCYWKQAKKGLFDYGVDAWWCDCTEPFEADWSGIVKPEPHQRLDMNTCQSKLYLDAAEINAYSLVHSQGVYEGQRSASDCKRVVNLTRSSYAGQHRYSTVTWSGDICGTWEALRRSIPEGLNFCATGEPYWTVDIGGFFVNYNPMLWFWRGDYHDGCRGLTDMEAMEPDPEDTGCLDLGYWELYTRWVQYAAFLPMFRSHGTDASREIWRFGEEGTPFYDTIAAFIRLRYQMLPYLYSLMAKVSRAGVMMMRALALEFPHDTATHYIDDEYLFGPSLLVCPVTSPKYYGVGSRKLGDTELTRPVYLPRGCFWYNFWSNAVEQGGTSIMAEAPLQQFPLYVRAGSIIPMTEAMQYVDEHRAAPYLIRIYCGADAEFELYEDAGDGYAYERGAFALIKMSWNEAAQQFLLGSRSGLFPELVTEREFHITLINATTGRNDLGERAHVIHYTGGEILLEVPLSGREASQ
jgi:alpha-D-xyloside xylohydrolase